MTPTSPKKITVLAMAIHTLRDPSPPPKMREPLPPDGGRGARGSRPGGVVSTRTRSFISE